jgi:hypothetical protein
MEFFTFSGISSQMSAAIAVAFSFCCSRKRCRVIAGKQSNKTHPESLDLAVLSVARPPTHID